MANTMAGRFLTVALGLLAMALAGAFPARAQRAAPLPQVYLVQNSGWMEPFLIDASRPAFLAEVTAFITATALASGEVVIASFNQHGQLLDRASPHVLYRGQASAPQIEAAVQRIDLPRRIHTDNAFTDADLDGALERTVGEVLKFNPALIWIITNNKSSKDNSQEYEKNTRRFNEALNGLVAFTRIVAFPITHPAKGLRYPGKPIPYEEKGYMIYGIAYDAPGSTAAADQLRSVATAPEVIRRFERPGLLKPLERSPLTFEAQRMWVNGVPQPPPKGQWLLLRDLPGGQPFTVHLCGRLRSEYFPQVIDNAITSATWETAEGGLQALPVQATIHLPPSAERRIECPPQLPAAFSTGRLVIERLRPLEILENVTIALQIPAIERPAGLAGFLQPEREIRGTLSLDLRDMRLTILEEFRSRLDHVAASGSLPEIFLRYRDVHAASTPMGVTLGARFSSLPLIGAIVGVLATLALSIAALVYLRRPRQHMVTIAGERCRVTLRPFETVRTKTPSGSRFEASGRLFGAPKVTPL
ncbi:MAG TPA: hypothetical protein PLQ12_03460 [Candidatus Defluviicoccus seviourii]|nr:hypothetical protein [Candidatus Defluviicoccus seviourii]